MKKILVFILAAAVAAAACSKKEDEFVLAKDSPAYALAKDLAAIVPALDPDANRPMITADGFTVTSGEVIQYILNNLGNRHTQLKTLDAGTLKPYIERNAQVLADRRLILAEAKKAGIKVAPEDVQKALDEQIAAVGTLEQYTEMLESNGISLDHVRASISEDVLLRRFLDEKITQGITVGEDEIRAAYDADQTATVRHVLLGTEGLSAEQKADVRKRIEDIRTRALSGEDFASLAREFSEDPGSKDNGGLYEDFGRGTMVKPFEDAAFNVPVGEISGVIETPYGFHILKVIERKKETRPLDEVRAELETRIRQAKSGQMYQDYIGQLRQSAKLTINLL